ncbi:MAG TPA: PQQ-dependent sugar dehydrogenase [Tepidisphaeraceae bacterium]|jgi:glucose/arabinose dehydrogenase|nr:PQQ-dependent sugar dehydrogenase [Tepidisphaeraceae bacterium]
MRYPAAVILVLGISAQVGRAQVVNDATLMVDHIVGGLDSPTGLAFMPNGGDAFVLEQHTGQVRLLKGRNLVDKEVLDLKVANDNEQGLLSIALHPKFSANGFVYLYYTQARDFDGGQPLANRIDRFHWDGSELTFDRHIKELPVSPGPNHNGGKILFGPDKRLYAVIGDLNRTELTENFERSTRVSRSAVILRLSDKGKALGDNPFYSRSNRGAKAPLNEIYAYGVRNSFGMDFDPVTRQLWDTENGPTEFDEINRLPAGSNSGWVDVMGPKSRSTGSFFRLAKLGKKAKYVDPQLSFKRIVAPTDLEFYKFDAMNDSRINDIFVGDYVTGSLYDLNLTSTRKSLALSGGLSDKVVDNTDTINDIRLGTGFGPITDLVSRPDGLYVLNLDGDLYRIATLGVLGPPPASGSMDLGSPVPEPGSLLLFAITGLIMGRRGRYAKQN